MWVCAYGRIGRDPTTGGDATNLSPISRGNDAKEHPPGDIFRHPSGMSSIPVKPVHDVGVYIVPSPKGALLKISPSNY